MTGPRVELARERVTRLGDPRRFVLDLFGRERSFLGENHHRMGELYLIYTISSNSILGSERKTLTKGYFDLPLRQPADFETNLPRA